MVVTVVGYCGIVVVVVAVITGVRVIESDSFRIPGGVVGVVVVVVFGLYWL